MGEASKLREARSSYAVKFREFVRIFSRDRAILICFFEGEDVKYYGPRLDMLRVDIRWEPINCGGKDAFLKLWNLLSEHSLYGTAKAAYFLDQNFDCPKAESSSSP